MSSQITYKDLRSGVRPSGDVSVVGDGFVVGADLRNWRSRWLAFGDAVGMLDDWLPRPLRRSRVGRGVPEFIDCDFSGLRCRRFHPGIVRFTRCIFRDVNVKLNMGVSSAHFRECTFSGKWEGNFDARPLSRDPARRVTISGNDFRGCRGFSLQGGVGRSDNLFDPALHLVLWRGTPAWDQVKEVALQDAYLGMLTSSMEGHGPLDLAQDWVIVQRDDLGEGVWRKPWQILPEGG